MMKVLKDTGNNKMRAAKVLDIDRRTPYVCGALRDRAGGRRGEPIVSRDLVASSERGEIRRIKLDQNFKLSKRNQ
jgi:hypothetical protein